MLQTKEIETLFRTYYRPLCLYALHYLGDPDAVEDVVQESFTALWRQENPVANVKAWLYSAVRNRSIDALRRTGKNEPLPSDLDGLISDDEAEDRSALEARLWTAIHCRAFYNGFSIFNVSNYVTKFTFFQYQPLLDYTRLLMLL